MHHRQHKMRGTQHLLLIQGGAGRCVDHHHIGVAHALRDALVNGSVLAITLEPSSGAPQGIPTGPIIAKGDIATL
mgnify:CR=1 FL=1